MKVGVSLKIDVSKIDKAMLFKGQKGTYLDAKVFIDIDVKDQYDNNGMITQEVSKDAPQGTQGAILGNCKVFWNDSQQQNQQPAQQQTARQATNQAVQNNVQGGFQPQQAQQINPQQPVVVDFDDSIPF